jgi:hypothetical protein
MQTSRIPNFALHATLSNPFSRIGGMGLDSGYKPLSVSFRGHSGPACSENPLGSYPLNANDGH